MHNKLSLASVFTTALLALTACGGETNSSASNNENTSHPEFSWAKVAVSNNYSPSGDITDLTPTFTWKAVSGATEYNLGTDYTKGGDWKEYMIPAAEAGCATASVCSYKPAKRIFNEADEIVWWVRGKKNMQWKSWSDPHVFTIKSSTSNNTSTPVAVSPKNNFTYKNRDNSPGFEWQWTPGKPVNKYVLGIETQDGKNWQVFPVNAPASSFKPSVNLANDSYTWWIRAEYKDKTWSKWSNGADFKINASFNSGYGHLLPVGNYNSLKPIFEWGNIRGTFEYQLGITKPTGEWLEYSIPVDINSGKICKRTRPSSLYPFVCSYQVTNGNFKPGDKITWYIRANTNNGWQDWSPATVFNINQNIIKPDAPTKLTAQIRNSTTTPYVYLKWQGKYAKYEVYRDGKLIATTKDTFRGPPGEYYADKDVIQGKTYIYTVKSVNKTGDKSDPSKALTVKVASTTAPGHIFIYMGNCHKSSSCRTSRQGTTSLSLAFRQATDDNNIVKEYYVYRDGVKIDTIPHDMTFSRKIVYTFDKGLTPNTPYTYSVKSVDAAGNILASSRDSIITTRPIDRLAPSTPKSLTGNYDNLDKKVHLRWEPSIDPDGDVTHYAIYESGNMIAKVSSRHTIYWVRYFRGGKQIQSGKTYTFEVRAIDQAGHLSEKSNPFSITIP